MIPNGKRRLENAKLVPRSLTGLQALKANKLHKVLTKELRTPNL